MITKNKPNIIFTGNGGILNYDEARVLTLKERKNNKPIASAIWDPNKFECIDAIINKNINQDNELFLRGRWQERIIDFDNTVNLNKFLKSFNLEFKDDNITLL